MLYYVSVKALVVKDDKVLLLQEESGNWELPGGGPDLGEAPTAALVREIREECGLNATILNPKPIYIWSGKKSDFPDPGFWIGYHVELDSLDFTPSNECTALEFFDKETVKTIDAFPNVTRLFEFFDPADFR